MISSTATLSLSPWAHQALSLAEMDELARRAVDLHCRVAVMQSRHRWDISVTSWATKDEEPKSRARIPLYRVDWHRQTGHLADLIDGALDQYERWYVFSAEELLSIQGVA